MTGIALRNHLLESAANWADGVAPGLGATITLAGSGQTTNNNLDPTSTYLAGLSFAASAGSFTVTGSAIWLQGPLSNLSAKPQTIRRALVLDGQNVPVNAVGDVYLNGPVSQLGGSFGIVKFDGGTLYLGGSNSYTGGTTIAAGNLVFMTTAAISASGKILIQSGAAPECHRGLCHGPSLAGQRSDRPQFQRRHRRRQQRQRAH